MMFVQKEEIIKKIKRYRDRNYETEFDIACQGGSNNGLAKQEEKIDSSSISVKQGGSGAAEGDPAAPPKPMPTDERIDSRNQKMSQGTNPDAGQRSTSNQAPKREGD